MGEAMRGFLEVASTTELVERGHIALCECDVIDVIVPSSTVARGEVGNEL